MRALLAGSGTCGGNENGRQRVGEDDADDMSEGFLWIEVDGNKVTGRFYDEEGTLNFERVVTK